MQKKSEEHPEFQRWNRGYLPHMQESGATYFVTFRLADSLPQEILQEYKQLTEGAQASRLREQEEDTNSSLDHINEYQRKILAYLDKGVGECYLARPEIAPVVVNALTHFDKQRYDLFTWCIMPNHVHVLFRPYPGEDIGKILHSWKSFSAKEANGILNRSGSFWQPEYYDRIVRNDKEFQQYQDYILNNPVKAGLVNWKWMGYGDRYAILAGKTPALR